MRKMCQSQQFVTWDAGFCGIKVRFADITTTVCHMGQKFLLTLLKGASRTTRTITANIMVYSFAKI